MKNFSSMTYITPQPFYNTIAGLPSKLNNCAVQSKTMPAKQLCCIQTKMYR